MRPIVLRLRPGDDLRQALEARARAHGTSWILLSGIGSLRMAMLRYAGAEEPVKRAGPLEILSLSGTVCPDGAHLHALLADAEGVPRGGHVCAGCEVATTAELTLLESGNVVLRRALDAETGYHELLVTQEPPH